MYIKQVGQICYVYKASRSNLLCFLLPANEKKVLVAAANTQNTLQCPVIIHPGRNHEAPFEIMRILQEAGGDASKIVMSHLDSKYW